MKIKNVTLDNKLTIVYNILIIKKEIKLNAGNVRKDLLVLMEIVNNVLHFDIIYNVMILYLLLFIYNCI